MKAIDQCKTLQDFKDLAAMRKEYIDFTDALYWLTQSKHIQPINDTAAELYSAYKVKEAIKLFKLKNKT